MKRNTWKKTIAFVLAFTLVAGTLPANVGDFLTGGTEIVARAGSEVAAISGLWIGDSDEIKSIGEVSGIGGETSGTAKVYTKGESVVLELNNFSYEGTGYLESGPAAAIYYEGSAPLIIKLTGTNTITTTGSELTESCGIYSNENLTIEGKGSLNVTSGSSDLNSYAIGVEAGLVISNCTVNATGGTADGASFGINSNDNIILKSGKLTANGNSIALYGLLDLDAGSVLTSLKAGDNVNPPTDTTLDNITVQKYITCEAVVPKTLAVGTEIYKGDIVRFKADEYYRTSGTQSGCLAKDTIYELGSIGYDEGSKAYRYTLTNKSGEPNIVMFINSPQLSAAPIGLKVVGGTGIEQDPYYFKMIPAPLEVKTDQPQVIKAGDTFKVEGAANGYDINSDGGHDLAVNAGTLFTVSAANNGLKLTSDSLNEIELPFGINSANTFLVEYAGTGDGFISFTENKIYSDRVDESNIHLGDVLAAGALFGAAYFQNSDLSSYGYSDSSGSWTVTATGATYDSNPPVNVTFADGKNAFVFDHIAEDKYYFNQTHIDLGAEVTPEPTYVAPTTSKSNQTWTIQMDDYTYDGTAHTPTINGTTYGSVTYTYYNADTNKELAEAPSEVGNYTVKVYASGNISYYGRRQTADYAITAAEPVVEPVVNVLNIDEQPKDVTCMIGEMAVFTVKASGENLTYQWEFNSGYGWRTSTMNGANTDTISIPMSELRNGQQYRCIVKSGNDAITSEAAAMYAASCITEQPKDCSGVIGETAKFTVKASGEVKRYQWQYNKGNGWENSGMTGYDTATVEVPLIESRNGQQYRCIVTLANGATQTSKAGMLQINSCIVAQPKDCSGVIGNTAKFTVKTLGEVKSYQWQYQRNNGWKSSGMSGSNTDTISVPFSPERNGQQYRCIVTFTDGTTQISEVGAMQVKPCIVEQPKDCSGAIGDTAKFTVKAFGEVKSYRWKYNKGNGWKYSDMSGYDTATIEVPLIRSRDGQQYRCIITTADGTMLVTSAVTMSVEK